MGKTWCLPFLVILLHLLVQQSRAGRQIQSLESTHYLKEKQLRNSKMQDESHRIDESKEGKELSHELVAAQAKADTAMTTFKEELYSKYILPLDEAERRLIDVEKWEKIANPEADGWKGTKLIMRQNRRKSLQKDFKNMHESKLQELVKSLKEQTEATAKLEKQLFPEKATAETETKVPNSKANRGEKKTRIQELVDEGKDQFEAATTTLNEIVTLFHGLRLAQEEAVSAMEQFSKELEKYFGALRQERSRLVSVKAREKEMKQNEADHGMSDVVEEFEAEYHPKVQKLMAFLEGVKEVAEKTHEMMYGRVFG